MSEFWIKFIAHIIGIVLYTFLVHALGGPLWAGFIAGTFLMRLSVQK